MKNNNFFKTIMDNSPSGYIYNRIIYDDNGSPRDYEIVDVNKSFEDMVGLGYKDLIGKRVSQLYKATNTKSPLDWDAFMSNIADKYKEKEFEYYFEFIDKYYRVKSILREGHIVTYLTDISGEIREREKLNILSDNVPIQVWYLNDSKTYGSANKAHADFIGCKKEDLVGKEINDLFNEVEARICIEGNEKVFKDKNQFTIKSWLYNRNNENRLLKITKKPKFNIRGEIEFVVCSAEDITEEYMSKEQNKIKEQILYSTIAFTQELLTNKNHYNALSNGLEMLGHATQVDRVYYWENHYDRNSQKWFTSQKFEWCLGHVEQQINNPKLQNIPFEEAGNFIELLSQNKTFNAHIKDIDDYGNTKQILQEQGILSILAIPIFAKGDFRGFIGFDSCNLEKEWSQVEISLLNSFILLYVKAIERNYLESQVLQIKENFYNFFNMIKDMLFVLDYKGNIVEINDSVLDRLNYTRKELIGKPVLMLHPKDKATEVTKNIEDLISKKIECCNLPAITKDGVVFHVETIVSEGLWSGEEVIFAISKDVSELFMSEEKFSKAFNDSGVSMFISKFGDGEILEVNNTFLDYIGYKKEEVIGKTTLDLNVIPDYENRENYKREIEINKKVSEIEIDISCRDNTKRKGLLNIVPININSEMCLLSSIIDISERIKYEEKILEISNQDPLTGIYNRRYVYERAEEIIEEYKRKGKVFSVSIVDIDNFKKINDTFGHQIGDCVLKEFTKILSQYLRLYDILGRFGGEEFIIILNHSNIEESKLVLERILDKVTEKIFIFDDNHIKLSFSAGISSCEEVQMDELGIDKLIGIADNRMYTAKKNGKSKIVYK